MSPTLCKALIALTIVASFTPSFTLASKVSIHSKPDEVPTSSAYTLKVRPAGHHKAWEEVPLYQPQVMEIDKITGSSRVYNTSVAYFDFDGSVEVSVIPQHVNKTESVRVRPLSYNIDPSRQGEEIRFVMNEPHHDVVVEVNGDVFGTLQIWTNSIETDPISRDTADEDNHVLYYEAGYHSLESEGGYLNLTSGQTLYLEGGAVLHGGVSMVNVTNVRIRGRGVLYHSPDHAVIVEYSEKLLIEGIAVLNPGHYSLLAASSQGLTVRNFRGISAVGFGDGIDLFCMKDVYMEHLFMRTSDDCIAVYQHRWDYYGDSRNITIRDASLWADVAHPIQMGLHGNTESPETMSNISFHNIDILDQREPQLDYQGCIAINVGDENMIENILFDDIRVENFRLGSLLSLRVTYNTKYNSAPGRGIRNVTIKDLSYSGKGGNTPALMGYSPDRAIEFIRFENLRINGEHIYDDMKKPSWYLTTDFVPMIWGNDVKNVTFV